MRKIIVFLFVFFIFLASFKDKKYSIDKIVDDGKKEDKTIIKLSYNNDVNNLDLEEYVIGVVACEMPASFNSEALKAMAIAARTYALYKINKNPSYVLKSTTSDQCYIDKDKMKKNWGSNYTKNYNKIKKAVNDTNNQYMTYKDEIIISFYFSISNGYTENCENVFSQKLDYLVSVDSSWDKEYDYKEKETRITVSDFLKKLNIDDSKIINLKIDRSFTGRVSSITINSKKFTGVKFRNLLSLRSTDVEISYDDKNVVIKTKGYGHGVGMSQYGANAMAKKGYKYDEILKHYYTGIKIMNK